MKRGKRIYDKLPAKQAETYPSNMLYIALIDKYRMNPFKGGRKYAMRGKNDKDVYSQAITMTELATGSIEICSVPGTRVDLVVNQLELA